MPPSRSNRSEGGAPQGVGGPFGRLVSHYGTLAQTRPLFPKFFENFLNRRTVAQITQVLHKSHRCCTNRTGVVKITHYTCLFSTER